MRHACTLKMLLGYYYVSRECLVLPQVHVVLAASAVVALELVYLIERYLTTEECKGAVVIFIVL